MEYALLVKGPPAQTSHRIRACATIQTLLSKNCFKKTQYSSHIEIGLFALLEGDLFHLGYKHGFE